MSYFSGLSEDEFQQILQACADVRIDTYPPSISQLILVDLLRKTSPDLAKMVLQLKAESVVILLQELREAWDSRQRESTIPRAADDDPVEHR